VYGGARVAGRVSPPQDCSPPTPRQATTTAFMRCFERTFGAAVLAAIPDGDAHSLWDSLFWERSVSSGINISSPEEEEVLLGRFGRRAQAEEERRVRRALKEEEEVGLKIMGVLVRSGADVNLPGESESRYGRWIIRPLGAACSVFDAAIAKRYVRWLLTARANPHELSYRGVDNGAEAYSPLLAACQRGHLDAVELLLRAGADPYQTIKLRHLADCAYIQDEPCELGWLKVNPISLTHDAITEGARLLDGARFTPDVKRTLRRHALGGRRARLVCLRTLVDAGRAVPWAWTTARMRFIFADAPFELFTRIIAQSWDARHAYGWRVHPSVPPEPKALEYRAAEIAGLGADARWLPPFEGVEELAMGSWTCGKCHCEVHNMLVYCPKHVSSREPIDALVVRPDLPTEVRERIVEMVRERNQR